MDEEIKQKIEELDITPDDLGCEQARLSGQIPELDEADAATKLILPEQKSSPILNSFQIPPGTPDLLAMAFRTIPQEKINRYKALYDGFVNQDMPFIEFAVELAVATNPDLMKRDMGRIRDIMYNRLVPLR
jgi:hypothetical protein